MAWKGLNYTCVGCWLNGLQIYDAAWITQSFWR